MLIVLGQSSISIDTCDALMLCRRLEQAAGARITGGFMSPSKKLLEMLATALATLGLAGCTIDSAWLFWKRVNIEAESQREANQHNADIAHWYGVNPFALGESERLALLANLPRIRAQDAIKRGSFDPMDRDGVYDLFMLAYADETLARKAQADAAELFVEQEMRKAAQNVSR